MNHEAHLSAEQSRARPSSRLSQPDGHTGRPFSDSRSPRPRPQKAVRLTIISKRRDFLAANAGRRAGTPGFVLLVHPRGDDQAVRRLGITVTKRVGNAVVRNRIKRRFRALARDLLPLSGHDGADHILIGRLPALDRDFADLHKDLEKALQKAKPQPCQAAQP
jgi:ribonuclease P protein component